jgi:hypothetical protein
MATETGRPSGSDLAEKSAGSAIEAWTKMRPLVLSAALATAALGVARSFAQFRLGISPGDTTAAGIFLGFFPVPIQAVVEAPLAVAIHRLILLGEVTPGIISLRWSYHWLFFAWLCAIGFASTVLVDTIDLAGGGVITPVIAIPGIIFIVKSAMVFPAVAIAAPSGGWRERLLTSWRQMDGNSWLFVRAILLAFLLLLPLALLIGLATVAARSVFLSDDVMRTIVTSGLRGAILPAYIMMAAGVASWLYAWVRDNKPA